MDLIEIQALMGSLKAATEITGSILKLKSTTDIKDKVIELQTALLEVQTKAISATTSQFELQEKVKQLEELLRLATEWGDQENRYSLACPWSSAAQVYALKRSFAEGEKPHFLCSHCFHDRRKVILNPQIEAAGSY